MEMCVCVCQIGNPLKIQKRKGIFDEYADADMARRGKKCPKVKKIRERDATVFVSVLEV